MLQTLSAKLTAAYGQGWSERNLAYMVKFAETLTDPNILQILCAKLSWSHFKDLIYIQDLLKREFYIEQRPEENPNLGIILCAGKKQELVELMELGQSGIHVAEYLTLLPEKALLQQKLHDAVTKARMRLDNRRGEDQ